MNFAFSWVEWWLAPARFRFMPQSAVIVPTALRGENFAGAVESIAATIVTHRAATQDNEPMFEADDGETKRGECHAENRS